MTLANVTQISMEVIHSATTFANVTQVSMEVVREANAFANVTQISAEVIVSLAFVDIPSPVVTAIVVG